MSSSNDDSLSWSTLHLQLQHLLRQELSMLREVLSQMKEEETAILKGPSKNYIITTRPNLTKELKKVQQQRHKTTLDLFKIFDGTLHKFSFNSQVFDSLISQDDEHSVETLSLRDQVVAMMQHIRQLKDQQSHANKGSFNSLDEELLQQDKPKLNQPPQLQTLDPKEEEEPDLPL